MAEPRKVYWDSCVWISLLSKDPGRVERCESLITLARQGDVQIWTSSLSLTEVYKHRNGQGSIALAADLDSALEAFFEQDFVMEVQLDHDIAVLARRLLRTHSPPLKKPADAIHLATAVANNLDELHTFDGDNLLPLDGLVRRADNQVLMIREPPPPILGQQDDLFAQSKVETPQAGAEDPDEPR